MTWRTIHLADVPATPWRNQGGQTHELAVWPAQGEWNWRMSVAEVTTSGPFSRFDGVTRWFAVLHGAGLDLELPTPTSDVDVAPPIHRLTAKHPPLCFDGAAVAHCQLIDGPTLDFNLMLRDCCLPARMVRVRGEAHELAHATKTIAVYAVDARASVRFNSEVIELPMATLVWRTVSKSATVHIRGAHVLWMEFST